MLYGSGVEIELFSYRVLLRENKTKVVTTIGNYLNNLESSEKADSELTNLCMCVTCAQYASWCHHHDKIICNINSTINNITEIKKVNYSK